MIGITTEHVEMVIVDANLSETFKTYHLEVRRLMPNGHPYLGRVRFASSDDIEKLKAFGIELGVKLWYKQNDICDIWLGAISFP